MKDNEQIWHVGRISHPDLLPDNPPPVAPSAISDGEQSPTPEGMKDHPVPRALETDEIAHVVGEFRQGAKLAQEAGFDGVEIHGANGYLTDQFTSDLSNRRTDQYGDSIENRLRLPLELEVVRAAVDVWGADRVGYRVSPSGDSTRISDSVRKNKFSVLASELNSLNLAYLHVIEPRAYQLPAYVSVWRWMKGESREKTTILASESSAQPIRLTSICSLSHR